MNIKRLQSNLLTASTASEERLTTSKLNWLNSKNSIGITMIFLLSLIVTSQGCKSLSQVKAIDLDLGGLEIEFYEPQAWITNMVQAPFPRLMPRTKRD
jgi:hypothetical protein